MRSVDSFFGVVDRFREAGDPDREVVDTPTVRLRNAGVRWIDLTRAVADCFRAVADD